MPKGAGLVVTSEESAMSARSVGTRISIIVPSASGVITTPSGDCDCTTPGFEAASVAPALTASVEIILKKLFETALDMYTCSIVGRGTPITT